MNNDELIKFWKKSGFSDTESKILADLILKYVPDIKNMDAESIMDKINSVSEPFITEIMETKG